MTQKEIDAQEAELTALESEREVLAGEMVQIEETIKGLTQQLATEVRELRAQREARRAAVRELDSRIGERKALLGRPVEVRRGADGKTLGLKPLAEVIGKFSAGGAA